MKIYTRTFKFYITIILLLSTSLLSASLLSARQKTKLIKVACVGDSITYGLKIENRERDSYPAQLQRILGNGYEVKNFGHSGATLLSNGHRPYVNLPEYKEALDYAADIVVIHLGINDTDPRNWPNYRDEFLMDYLDLINSFRTVNPDVCIYVARMTPIGDRHPRFISGTSQWHEQIQRVIESLPEADFQIMQARNTTPTLQRKNARAKASTFKRIKLIDFHEPFYPYPGLFPDAIHPNVEGAGIMANVVYSAITGDYGGLQLSCMYTDNMVLQRDRPIEIKGLADAGSEVCVELSNATVGKNIKNLHKKGINIRKKGMTIIKKTKTNYLGKWSVTLESLPAGEDYTLKISTSDEEKVFTNVAIGEVWLCSGQSNMEFPVSQSTFAKQALNEDSNLRLYDMKARWRTNNVAWPASVADSINHLQYFRPTHWEEANAQNISGFSAVAYNFGKMLQDSLKVPVGLICNAVGGSTTESWIDRHTLEMQFPAILRNWLNNDFIQGWARGRAARNLENSDSPVKRHPYEPCYLYESAILPLQQFPIKGVIWYQGESNAHNVEAHEKLFKLLVESWRHNWESNDESNGEVMPFYYVQLSSLSRPSWPWFRDSQRRLMDEIPHSGMVVSSDYGDSLNVHPTTKKPIGERLARLALVKDYNYTNIMPSGPIFDKVEAIQNDTLVVSFRYSDGLHALNSQDSMACEVKGFEIAEIDGVYYPAHALIKNNKVYLVSNRVSNPRYVRYAWKPFTRANLVNKANLPASTFRAGIE